MALPASIAAMDEDFDGADIVSKLQKSNEATKAAEKSRKETMSLLAGMLKRKSAKEAAVQATNAKLEAAKAAQAAEEEEEQAAEVPEAPEFPDAGILGLADEPEPPTFDEDIWQPLQAVPAAPLDLEPVSIPDLPSASNCSPAELFAVLLQQQMVFQLLPASPQLLQLLYKAAVHTGNQHATHMLTQYYQGLQPQADALWVPSMSDHLDAMRLSGYCSKVLPSSGSGTGRSTRGRGSTSAAGSSKGDTVVPQGGGDDMQTDPAAGSCARAGDPQQVQAIQRLHQVLQIIQAVCGVEQHRATSLHDYSRASKVSGCGVLLALIELQLVPSLRRVLLLELSHALSALCLCWGRLGSSTWDSVVKEMSGHVPQLGPAYPGALLVTREMVACDDHQQQLRTACVLALLASLVPKAGKGSSSKAGSSDDPGKRALALLKQAGNHPRQLLTALHVAASASDQPGDKTRTDYHKVLAVMECAHLVVWDLVHRPESVSEADRHTGSALRVYMEDMNQIVNRSRVPSAITLSAAISGWLYLLEIDANIENIRGANLRLN